MISLLYIWQFYFHLFSFQYKKFYRFHEFHGMVLVLQIAEEGERAAFLNGKLSVDVLY